MAENISLIPHIDAQLNPAGDQRFYEVYDNGHMHRMSEEEGRHHLAPQMEKMLGSMSILGAGQSQETFGTAPPTNTPEQLSPKEELRELRNKAGDGTVTEAEQARLRQLEERTSRHRYSRFMGKVEREQAKRLLAHYEPEYETLTEARELQGGQFKRKDGSIDRKKEHDYEVLRIRTENQRDIASRNSRRRAKRRYKQEKRALASRIATNEDQTDLTPEQETFTEYHRELEQSRKDFLQRTVGAQLNTFASKRAMTQAGVAYNAAFTKFADLIMGSRMLYGASERRLKAVAAQLAVQELEQSELIKAEIFDGLQQSRVGRARLWMARQHLVTKAVLGVEAATAIFSPSFRHLSESAAMAGLTMTGSLGYDQATKLDKKTAQKLSLVTKTSDADKQALRQEVKGDPYTMLPQTLELRGQEEQAKSKRSRLTKNVGRTAVKVITILQDAMPPRT